MFSIKNKTNIISDKDKIYNFFKEFKRISIEFVNIAFPLILFNYCVYSYGSINLFFISSTYKDPDMINVIGISNIY